MANAVETTTREHNNRETPRTPRRSTPSNIIFEATLMSEDGNFDNSKHFSISRLARSRSHPQFQVQVRTAGLASPFTNNIDSMACAVISTYLSTSPPQRYRTLSHDIFDLPSLAALYYLSISFNLAELEPQVMSRLKEVCMDEHHDDLEFLVCAVLAAFEVKEDEDEECGGDVEENPIVTMREAGQMVSMWGRETLREMIKVRTPQFMLRVVGLERKRCAETVEGEGGLI